jgi:NTP pyrophosphatase (non-canonical NTP hydrolase)
MNNVLQKLLAFREARNWVQYHKPQNLAQSLMLEAAEVLEIFQWTSTEDSLTNEQKEALSEELADVYNWVLLLSHDIGINIEEAALKKIDKNDKKYPVEKSHGSAKKYTKL